MSLTQTFIQSLIAIFPSNVAKIIKDYMLFLEYSKKVKLFLLEMQAKFLFWKNSYVWMYVSSGIGKIFKYDTKTHKIISGDNWLNLNIYWNNKLTTSHEKWRMFSHDGYICGPNTIDIYFRI